MRCFTLLANVFRTTVAIFAFILQYYKSVQLPSKTIPKLKLCDLSVHSSLKPCYFYTVYNILSFHPHYLYKEPIAHATSTVFISAYFIVWEVRFLLHFKNCKINPWATWKLIKNTWSITVRILHLNNHTNRP